MTTVMNNISKMFPSEKGRQNFIIMSMLTFGMTLDTMANLLDMSGDEFNKKYIRYSGMWSAIYRRGQHIANTQEEAVGKFMKFFRRLCLAYIDKDRDLIKRIIQEINDTEASEVLKKRKEISSLSKQEKRRDKNSFSDQDILAVLKYQIKYGLTNDEIARIYFTNRYHYTQRVELLLTQYPEYRNAYETLVDAQDKLDRITKPNSGSGRK